MTFLIILAWFIISSSGQSDVTWTKKKPDPPGIPEFCESETFGAKCWPDHVISIQSAQYGRMRIGRCVEADLGYLGCAADVLDLADRKCSGRRECQIRVPDGELDLRKPCYKELKVYLEISYSCLKIIGEDQLCTVPITTTPGNLSPLSTYKHNCGTKTQPWVLQADPGQRINLTMTDFTSYQSVQTSGTTKPPFQYGPNGDGDQPVSPTLPPVCVPYGYVWEPSVKRNVTLCRSRYRKSIVYQSESNSVEVVFLPNIGKASSKPAESPNFLIRFEATGCSDLRILKDAWVQRTENETVIGCHSTRQTWHLQCQGHQWVGVIGNCTQHLLAAQKEARVGLPAPKLTHDMLIVLIIAVSVSLCLGIVAVGMVCLRRSQSKRLPMQLNYDNVQTYEDCFAPSDIPTFSTRGATHPRLPSTSACISDNGCPQAFPVLPSASDQDYKGSLCSALSSPYRIHVGPRLSHTSKLEELDDSSATSPDYQRSTSTTKASGSSGYFVLDRDLKPVVN